MTRMTRSRRHEKSPPQKSPPQKSRHQKNPPNAGLRHPLLTSLTLVGALILIVAVSTFWPRKVPLSPQAYEISLALYRVCNQRDQDGLRKLQEQLSQQPESSQDPSMDHLRGIIDKASLGNWTAAMKDTRQAIEDQVTHAN